ncbi:MAG: radical SAM protein [Acidobacteriota bacterium]
MPLVGGGHLPEGSDGQARQGIRRLHVYLIKPSKYDDDGYVIRYVRGVLPSNTLACLASLTDDLRTGHALGESLSIEMTILDETVQKVDVDAIARRARRRSDTLTVIALAGVQTNQFPRASDLALRFRTHGLPVLIGGFHVSGWLALMEHLPDHMQVLVDQGVTLVRGEVEDSWESILRDALHDRLPPIYDFSKRKPDLTHQPIPRVPSDYMRRFVFRKFGTIDAGRGCPFDCSFCTIINVQGREMRHRSAGLIEERIRHDYHAMGVNFYFFTDDNFARNKNWEAIMDVLVRLRRDEGMKLQFMMQVDVQSYKIPGFIAKAKEAGCSNVFIGMESINPKNLEAVGKTQNQVEDFKNLIAAWHNAGIFTHVGYIVGFPHDTPESVREDVRRLAEEVKVDMASFFILVPLPGSLDHKRMVERGDAMDSDHNKYDSFHETFPHPNFPPGELERTYREAWASFYGPKNMEAVLFRAHRGTYWDILKNYFWYKNALIDGQHPMISGFFRIKDRTDRRPGYAVDGRWAHLKRRIPEWIRHARGVWRLLFEMEEVWLQTRRQAWQRIEFVKELQHRVANLLIQIRGIDYRDARQWLIDTLHQFRGKDALEFRQHLDLMLRRMREFDAKRALTSIAEHISAIQQQIEVQERLKACTTSASRMKAKLASFVKSATRQAVRVVSPRTTSREPLARFWDRTIANLKRGKVFRINPVLFAYNFVRDVRLFVAFVIHLAVAGIRRDRLHG